MTAEEKPKKKSKADIQNITGWPEVPLKASSKVSEKDSEGTEHDDVHNQCRRYKEALEKIITLQWTDAIEMRMTARAALMNWKLRDD
tara:strand:- start:74 stop:334 length:261 start_codon:yes stop_codon:yes gene_type:complete